MLNKAMNNDTEKTSHKILLIDISLILIFLVLLAQNKLFATVYLSWHRDKSTLNITLDNYKYGS